METNVDLMTPDGSKAKGEVASKVAGSKLNVNKMKPYIYNGKSYVSTYSGEGDRTNPDNYEAQPIQTNASLRREEWIRLDEAVIGSYRERLRGIQDLIDAGLTYDLGNGMGTTKLEWHTVGEALEADMTMDGVNKTQDDAVDFKTNYIPLPIISVDYKINQRKLEESRNLGNPINTIKAERGSRRVSEYLESMLFTDTSYNFDGANIYSYVNYPDRNQVTLDTNWDASAKSAEDIKDDVIAMKQAAIDSRRYGPYQLYIPTNYETVLDDDYDVSGASTQTIRQRIEGISGINSVKVIDTLPNDNVLLVQMDSETVRLVRGMGVENVQWQEEGNLVNRYKVMTIQVPQIRSDHNGRTGIVHLSS